MTSAVICYAAADRDSARELLRYLHLNCTRFTFDIEEFDGPAGLLNAVERALSADFPILLLSPNSAPPVWRREEWEAILVDEARRFETQIAYVLLKECRFPLVLRRGLFFDLSEKWQAGQRSLRRRLLDNATSFGSAIELPPLCVSALAEPDALRRLEHGLVDQPGIAADVNRTLALNFAHNCASDFEGVFWLNCAHRSRAGILGDLAQATGLKLRGTVETNAQALRAFCADRRILLVLENLAPADAEWMICPGKSSFLIVAECSLPSPISLEQTAALFARWRADSNGCLRALGDAQAHLRNLSEYGDHRRDIAVSLAWSAYSLMKQIGRIAEASEFLDTMIDAMRGKGEVAEVARLEWERSWIMEEWDQSTPGSSRTKLAVQLSLFD